MREEHRQRVVDGLGPIFLVAEVATLLGVSYQYANTFTERMAELQFVGEMTGNRRDRRFRYDPHIAILADD